jgi:UDP-glucose 4-epimerase
MSEARGAGVGRLVFASTIAVYGRTAGPLATETSPLNPETPYARTKLAAEDVVRTALGPEGRSLGAVLRLAAIYGPKVKGNYRTLVDALARGRFVPIGNGRNRRTLVHERDAARALLLALESPAAAGKTFNVTDGSVHTTDDIVAAICRALGRPAPRWHVPRAAAFAAAEACDLVLAAAGREAAIGDRLRRYVEDVAVDGSAIQRELGFRPAYSLDEGWREAVAERR